MKGDFLNIRLLHKGTKRSPAWACEPRKAKTKALKWWCPKRGRYVVNDRKHVAEPVYREPLHDEYTRTLLRGHVRGCLSLAVGGRHHMKSALFEDRPLVSGREFALHWLRDKQVTIGQVEHSDDGVNWEPAKSAQTLKP